MALPVNLGSSRRTGDTAERGIGLRLFLRNTARMAKMDINDCIWCKAHSMYWKNTQTGHIEVGCNYCDQMVRVGGKAESIRVWNFANPVKKARKKIPRKKS